MKRPCRALLASAALMLLASAVSAGEPVESKDFSKELQTTTLRATVRVVNSARGTEGTGTIIGRKDVFEYVLTAHHVVEGAERVELALFTTGATKPDAVVKEVDVVARAKEADLAILRFPSRNKLPSLTLCPANEVSEEKTLPGLTVGCDGEEPTCRVERIIDRKRVRKPTGEGPTLTWELADEPASGRSGGPLLDTKGRLIGVVSGRSDGKGYCTHIGELYPLLKRNDLEFLAHPTDDAPKPMP